MSSTEIPTATETDIDLEAIRAKYAEEKEKRLKAEGNEQYIEVKGEFSYFLEDPYLDPDQAPEPITDQVEVVIIGGGFGGLLSAVELTEAGITDFRILEKAGDFGGTWYWNRYPGVACDIEAYVYLPLLEETGYIPKNKFATGQEIMDHCARIAKQWNLYDKAKFQAEVTVMQWNEDLKRWHIETKAGDKVDAKFVILANGPLHRPKLPGIKGINEYKGHTFHTSRWDYATTGGDTTGGLTGLKGKRVGIIGTGATAVQCIPHLAEHAEHLYVFQRRPSSIDVRNDRPTTDEFVRTLKPGWHKHRMDNFNTLTTGGIANEDLVNDGWTEIMRTVGQAMVANPGNASDMQKILTMVEVADAKKMTQIRDRVDEVVKDPETAEALKPWYRQFCKRPCFDDRYLKTFNRPNVTLVDTKGEGVREINERGVVYDGKTYEVDCLVFATGFEVGTDYTRRSGYEIVGRGGVKLSERWADGAATLHGIHSHGFPNCFIHQISQGGLAFNFVHTALEVAKNVAWIVKEANARGIETVEATEAAEQAWLAQSSGTSQLRQDFLESCTPGYYNNEGRIDDPKISRNAPFGAGPIVFFNILESWRKQSEMKGLELTKAEKAN
jgi:cyclohexanone monooxygenase